MPKPPQIDESIKRANSSDHFNNNDELLDLLNCVESPLYFMKKFMKIQHALKGNIQFEPFPYQERIIDAFHRNRNVIAMTGRQQGKCVTSDTKVMVDGEKKNIGSLLKLSPKERVVMFLESLLIKLS